MKIGILGGTGLENAGIIESPKEIKVTTPYGDPSDTLTVGKIGNVEVVLLARYGRQHQINPTNINYKANVWALKEQGCSHIFAPTAWAACKRTYNPATLSFQTNLSTRLHTASRRFTKANKSAT